MKMIRMSHFGMNTPGALSRYKVEVEYLAPSSFSLTKQSLKDRSRALYL